MSRDCSENSPNLPFNNNRKDFLYCRTNEKKAITTSCR